MSADYMARMKRIFGEDFELPNLEEMKSKSSFATASLHTDTKEESNVAKFSKITSQISTSGLSINGFSAASNLGSFRNISAGSKCATNPSSNKTPDSAHQERLKRIFGDEYEDLKGSGSNLFSSFSSASNISHHQNDQFNNVNFRESVSTSKVGSDEVGLESAHQERLKRIFGDEFPNIHKATGLSSFSSAANLDKKLISDLPGLSNDDLVVAPFIKEQIASNSETSESIAFNREDFKRPFIPLMKLKIDKKENSEATTEVPNSADFAKPFIPIQRPSTSTSESTTLTRATTRKNRLGFVPIKPVRASKSNVLGVSSFDPSVPMVASDPIDLFCYAVERAQKIIGSSSAFEGEEFLRSLISPLNMDGSGATSNTNHLKTNFESSDGDCNHVLYNGSNVVAGDWGAIEEGLHKYPWLWSVFLTALIKICRFISKSDKSTSNFQLELLPSDSVNLPKNPESASESNLQKVKKFIAKSLTSNRLFQIFIDARWYLMQIKLVLYFDMLNTSTRQSEKTIKECASSYTTSSSNFSDLNLFGKIIFSRFHLEFVRKKPVSALKRITIGDEPTTDERRSRMGWEGEFHLRLRVLKFLPSSSDSETCLLTDGWYTAVGVLDEATQRSGAFVLNSHQNILACKIRQRLERTYLKSFYGAIMGSRSTNIKSSSRVHEETNHHSVVINIQNVRFAQVDAEDGNQKKDVVGAKANLYVDRIVPSLSIDHEFGSVLDFEQILRIQLSWNNTRLDREKDIAVGINNTRSLKKFEENLKPAAVLNDGAVSLGFTHPISIRIKDTRSSGGAVPLLDFFVLRALPERKRRRAKLQVLLNSETAAAATTNTQTSDDSEVTLLILDAVPVLESCSPVKNLCSSDRFESSNNRNPMPKLYFSTAKLVLTGPGSGYFNTKEFRKSVEGKRFRCSYLKRYGREPYIRGEQLPDNHSMPTFFCTKGSEWREVGPSLTSDVLQNNHSTISSIILALNEERTKRGAELQDATTADPLLRDDNLRNFLLDLCPAARQKVPHFPRSAPLLKNLFYDVCGVLLGFQLDHTHVNAFILVDNNDSDQTHASDKTSSISLTSCDSEVESGLKLTGGKDSSQSNVTPLKVNKSTLLKVDGPGKPTPCTSSRSSQIPTSPIVLEDSEPSQDEKKDPISLLVAKALEAGSVEKQTHADEEVEIELFHPLLSPIINSKKRAGALTNCNFADEVGISFGATSCPAQSLPSLKRRRISQFVSASSATTKMKLASETVPDVLGAKVSKVTTIAATGAVPLSRDCTVTQNHHEPLKPCNRNINESLPHLNSSAIQCFHIRPAKRPPTKRGQFESETEYKSRLTTPPHWGFSKVNESTNNFSVNLVNHAHVMAESADVQPKQIQFSSGSKSNESTEPKETMLGCSSTACFRLEEIPTARAPTGPIVPNNSRKFDDFPSAEVDSANNVGIPKSSHSTKLIRLSIELDSNSHEPFSNDAVLLCDSLKKLLTSQSCTGHSALLEDDASEKRVSVTSNVNDAARLSIASVSTAATTGSQASQTRNEDITVANAISKSPSQNLTAVVWKNLRFDWYDNTAFPHNNASEFVHIWNFRCSEQEFKVGKIESNVPTWAVSSSFKERYTEIRTLLNSKKIID